VARPLAIKSWARQALQENRRDELDLRDMERALDGEEDPKRADSLKKRIASMKKRAAEAKR
jgi:hypothetical protein